MLYLITYIDKTNIGKPFPYWNGTLVRYGADDTRKCKNRGPITELAYGWRTVQCRAIHIFRPLCPCWFDAQFLLHLGSEAYIQQRSQAI